MKKIHVGFLLSYDYDKLKKSIPPVYKEADAIFIAMDHKNRTWSGETFEVDPAFFEWLEAFDVDNKIQLYKDDFYDADLIAIENDNRERHMLSLKMGIGNWLVQIDSDEYFVDFANYVKDLRRFDSYLDNPEKNNIQIAAYLINLYKYTDNGVLFIKEPTRGIIATNYPNYKVARNTRKRIVYTQNILLHESIARDEAELVLKLDNWGHNIEVHDKEAFLEKWRTTNKSNYKERENFFYIEPEKWKHLEFCEGNTIEEIRKNINLEGIMPSKFFIAKKNFGQYFKHLFK
ncbi:MULTISPECIES: hypothetical protein [unclassified Bizionia]|uniref:hypothetical protein n=1 Tax=unclassified Bizionia TaxID=2626393 RepID=UPI00204D103C|nr:hypothetical protein [Bizionia sp. M204]UPS90552.1 hypothetical protein GMA17_01925 [Bizionia sp. M204]